MNVYFKNEVTGELMCLTQPEEDVIDFNEQTQLKLAIWQHYRCRAKLPILGVIEGDTHDQVMD